MIEIDLPVNPDWPHGRVVSLFESAAREGGCRPKQFALAKYPGAVHWHLTMDNQKGTLEATWWPAKGRFWLHLRSNRDGPWVAAMTSRLSSEFEQACLTSEEP